MKTSIKMLGLSLVICGVSRSAGAEGGVFYDSLRPVEEQKADQGLLALLQKVKVDGLKYQWDEKGKVDPKTLRSTKHVRLDKKIQDAVDVLFVGTNPHRHLDIFYTATGKYLADHKTKLDLFNCEVILASQELIYPPEGNVKKSLREHDPELFSKQPEAAWIGSYRRSYGGKRFLPKSLLKNLWNDR